MTSFFRWLEGHRPQIAKSKTVFHVADGVRAGDHHAAQSMGTVSSPEAHVEQLIKVMCAEPVSVLWTSNRRTILSYRRSPVGVVLRLHRAFIAAQVNEVRAIVRYIAGERGHTKELFAFVAQAMATAEPRRPKNIVPTAGHGVVHNLGAIFAALNATYFYGSAKAVVSWGRASSQRTRRRSIQLGCYVVEDNLIRIHPALDQEFVPSFVVEGVMYHEMLHEALGVKAHNGRRLIHPPEFIALEKSHPNHERCVAWEAKNLRRLLSYSK